MTVHRGTLPTLTEVIDIQDELLDSATAPVALPPESLPLEAQPAWAADTGVALTTQVLETLRPRIDALLESRLQAVIAPELSRLADEVVHSLRGELAGVMHTLVAQAVEDVLARRRKP
jgi:hypothetical protein